MAVGSIVVRTLGPLRGPWRLAAEDYLQRLQGRLPLRWEEDTEVRIAPDATAREVERARAKEAERLLRGLPRTARLVALDAQGDQPDSLQFARLIAEWQRAADPTYLLVGGHLGLHEALRARSRLLALSHLTFTHQMVPAILFEQIYRGHSILTGGPYHR